MYNFIFRFKHPLKVHVWVGISKKGRTGICVFEGIMNGPVYIDILDKTLIPFLKEVYPEKHRFFQDNDPKHVSRCAQNFYQQNNIKLVENAS